MIRRFQVDITTAADGSATAYTPFLSGFIESIQYVKDDFTDGVDFTITTETTAQTVWTETNVNASVVKAPRQATHTTAGVAALYAAAGTAVLDRIAVGRERIKFVIASGGNATSGTFYVTVDDGR